MQLFLEQHLVNFSDKNQVTESLLLFLFNIQQLVMLIYLFQKWVMLPRNHCRYLHAESWLLILKVIYGTVCTTWQLIILHLSTIERHISFYFWLIKRCHSCFTQTRLKTIVAWVKNLFLTCLYVFMLWCYRVETSVQIIKVIDILS